MSNNASASPHMSHLSHNGSAPASPSMSSTVQGGGGAQQGYQASPGYASPAQYAQYAGQAPAEQYRSSPTGSNGSMPLPSMRSIDPNHAQQAHQAQHMANSHLQGPSAPYYHGSVLPPPSHYPSVTSDPTGRYALPQDNRVMSGGRHKKEIKRRTKTGCLTCRKRRIKCDEAHPSCRNCQKSKRECLGYDPIFKQNPGPTAIQPALSSAPSQSSSMSSSANPYGNQPPMYAQGVGMNYDQNMSPSVNSAGQAQQPQYTDYSAVSAIDPSLEALAPSQPNTAHSQAMPNFREELQKGTTGSGYSANTTDTPHLRGGAPSKYTPLSTSSRYANRELTYDAPAQPTSVTEILDAIGPAADPLPANSNSSQDPGVIDELKHLYHSIYSIGLENFLETKYFPIKGVSRLLSDKPLLEQFIVLIEHFARTPSNDNAGLSRVMCVETRLIWALANMVRAAAATNDTTNGSDKPEDQAAPPSPEDPVQAAHRLTVFENLLTFNFAESNPLYKVNPDTWDYHKNYHKGRELEFWYQLGDFVTIKDSDPEAGQRIDEILLKMRNLLDGRENRDVLYSVAVVRAIGNRVADFAEQEVPHHLDETDDRNKLFVAKKFIRDESSGNGTTNVIRRLCDMVLRSWTPPASEKTQ